MPQASTLITQANVTSLVAIKTSPCIVKAIRAWQAGIGADAYVEVFDSDTTGGITLGTTQPDWVVHLDQGVGEVTVGDGLPSEGLVFNNGIVVASTTASVGTTTSTTQVRVAVM